MKNCDTANAGPEVTGSPGVYEDATRQIREVLAVRMVSDPHGEIDEIHVVNHKKISIAQVNDNGPVSWGAGRVHLLGTRLDFGAYSEPWRRLALLKVQTGPLV